VVYHRRRVSSSCALVNSGVCGVGVAGLVHRHRPPPQHTTQQEKLIACTAVDCLVALRFVAYPIQPAALAESEEVTLLLPSPTTAPRDANGGMQLEEWNKIDYYTVL